MFWLLVFAATLTVLAWRSVRLAHVTGVLGIALLFYGWLGESGGRFVLLLIAYLVVFVPLNVPALRQEWISRVVLDAFLQRLPHMGSAEAKPAGTLLEGNWQTRLTLAAIPAPPDALARECMASVFLHRLQSPLWPHTPTAAQGQIASALYASAAIDAFDLDCISNAPSPLTAALRTQTHWQLAQNSAALTGRLPRTLQQQNFSAAVEGLLATARLAHGPYRAVLGAAHQDNPHLGLVAFDSALFQWLRLAITQAVRALVNGLTLGRLVSIPAGLLEDEHIALHRAAACAQTRMAVLCNLLLALDAFGQSLASRALIGNLQNSLGCALAAQAKIQALLQFHALARAPNLEQPLFIHASRSALRASEQSCWQAVQDLPSRPGRWALGLLLFPLGRSAAVGTAELQRACARALLEHEEVRVRLLAGEWSTELSELAARSDALNKVGGPLQQLAQAKLEPEPADDSQRLEQALRMAFVSPAQHALLVEALAFAQTLKNTPAREPKT